MRHHAHLHVHLVQIAEVYVSGDVQRVFIVSVEFEILEQQIASFDSYRVVREAHLHAVGIAEDVARIQEHLSIHLRCTQRTFHIQFSFCEAAESEQLLWNESVCQCQRHAAQRQGSIEISIAGRVVRTSEIAYL